MPPFFTDDDALAAELMALRRAENDPLWRLPLWRPYDAMLESKVADLNNVGTGGHGGAITAALFLRRFVTRDVVAASRHFRLDAGGQARPAGRRRLPDRRARSMRCSAQRYA